MGLIDDALAAIDRAKRIGKRNLADLSSSPDLVAEKLNDQVRNFNAERVPAASGGELFNRPMTEAEALQKYLSMGAFPPGMGMGGSAARVVKPLNPLTHASTAGQLHSLGMMDDAAYGRMMRAPVMDQELLNLLHSEAVNLHGLRRGMLNQR